MESVAEIIEGRETQDSQVEESQVEETSTDEDAAGASESPAVVEKTAKTVPLEALEAERKRWQERLENNEKRQVETERRYEELAGALKEWHRRQEQAEKPKPPEFDQDPVANLDHRNREMQERFEAMQRQLEQNQQTQQQRQEMERLGQAIAYSEQQVAQQTPDYYDALNYWRNYQIKASKVMYPQATDDQLMQAVHQQEMAAAAQALNTGRNPAQVAYEIAQIFGYQPKSAEAQAETEDQLKALEKGVKQSKTLGPGANKAEDWSDKSDDELMAALQYATSDLIRQ